MLTVTGPLGHVVLPLGALLGLTLVLLPPIFDDLDDPIGVQQANPWQRTRQVYDFIVVGGGTAGCVVARRLAELPGRPSVLLLEAGGDGSIISNMPVMNLFIVSDTYNWGYDAEPNGQSCLGIRHGRCRWHR